MSQSALMYTSLGGKSNKWIPTSFAIRPALLQCQLGCTFDNKIKLTFSKSWQQWQCTFDPWENGYWWWCGSSKLYVQLLRAEEGTQLRSGDVRKKVDGWLTLAKKHQEQFKHTYVDIFCTLVHVIFGNKRTLQSLTKNSKVLMNNCLGCQAHS